MSNAVVLGEAGIPHDDETYAGETSTVSMDYVRRKISEFQAVLNGLDASYNAALSVFAATNDPTLDELLLDYERNSPQIKLTAETLNAAAMAVNMAGGRMGVLSIPQTLGFAPVGAVALSAAAVAAIAAIAGWVTYSQGYSAAVTDAIRVVRENVTNADEVAIVEAKLREAEEAQRKINLPDLSSIAGGAKILAIAALAFFAWRSFDSWGDR